MTPLPLSDLIAKADLRARNVDAFVPPTPQTAPYRATLLTRLLVAAPLIDQLVTACENLEPDTDNANLHAAITLAPQLRAVLDGKS